MFTMLQEVLVVKRQWMVNPKPKRPNVERNACTAKTERSLVQPGTPAGVAMEARSGQRARKPEKIWPTPKAMARVAARLEQRAYPFAVQIFAEL